MNTLKNFGREISIEENISNMADPHYGFKCSTCNKPVIVPEIDGIFINVPGREVARLGGYIKVKKGPFTDRKREIICNLCES